MESIHNPILRGWHPDPSLLRVGDDYYLATSTFEWFPGVRLHHSRDLMNWELLGHALTEKHLNLAGVIDSAGIWAPSLSFADGTFFLVYTMVRTRVGPFKDVHNYLVTATDITGPWSKPVYLNSSGFDPSLFHDEDGRKWLFNMEWDPRADKPSFAGIVAQEYDHENQRLIGTARNILKKELLIEGPNVYRHNDYYYMMLAEGGTGWEHSISMARAKSILGPYEVDPEPFILSTRHNPENALQKTGHGSLVQTPGGEWWVAYLCGRPLLPERRCVTGRETAISPCYWSDDGWLRFNSGVLAQVEEPAPAGLKRHPYPPRPERDGFADTMLDPEWISLRRAPSEEWLSLSERPGWLRLRGGESVHSLFKQSLVARRIEECDLTAETCMEFSPLHFTQSAGLICWYDTRTHYYLKVTHDEKKGTILGITSTDDGNYSETWDSMPDVSDWENFYLRTEIKGSELKFSASPDGKNWFAAGGIYDASHLSDDYGQGLHFTGAVIGLCVQDLRGTRINADFDYFEMVNNKITNGNKQQ